MDSRRACWEGLWHPDCSPEGPRALYWRPPLLPMAFALLVPTLAAPVAAVPSGQEREAIMSPHLPAGGCREGPPVPVPSKAAGLHGRRRPLPVPSLWGEWSHLSRKPLQGHTVTALDSRARPRLGHEGNRTAGQPLGDLWHLLPRVHTCR